MCKIEKESVRACACVWVVKKISINLEGYLQRTLIASLHPELTLNRQYLNLTYADKLLEYSTLSVKHPT